MDELRKFIFGWSENYIKSRDAFYKKIQSIDYKDDCLIINYKDYKEKVIPVLYLSNIELKEKNEDIIIITLNNRKNLDYLCYNWDKLSEFTSLKIYFINPFSSLELKWVINPHNHSKICDNESLKRGLTAMFESVEPMTEEMLKHKI